MIVIENFSYKIHKYIFGSHREKYKSFKRSIIFGFLYFILCLNLIIFSHAAADKPINFSNVVTEKQIDEHVFRVRSTFMRCFDPVGRCTDEEIHAVEGVRNAIREFDRALLARYGSFETNNLRSIDYESISLGVLEIFDFIREKYGSQISENSGKYLSWFFFLRIFDLFIFSTVFTIIVIFEFYISIIVTSKILTFTSSLEFKGHYRSFCIIILGIIFDVLFVIISLFFILSFVMYCGPYIGLITSGLRGLLISWMLEDSDATQLFFAVGNDLGKMLKNLDAFPYHWRTSFAQNFDLRLENNIFELIALEFSKAQEKYWIFSIVDSGSKNRGLLENVKFNIFDIFRDLASIVRLNRLPVANGIRNWGSLLPLAPAFIHFIVFVIFIFIYFFSISIIKPLRTYAIFAMNVGPMLFYSYTCSFIVAIMGIWVFGG